MKSFSILGTGSYLPVGTVLSSELDEELGFPTGTVEAKSGVFSRRRVDTSDTTSSMAAAAAEAALAEAGLGVRDLDLIISASGTVERAIPCSAVLVQKRLGLSGSSIPCFDVNSTCLSFLTALDVAAAFIATGAYRTVLIVSSDIPSLGLDRGHLESFSIFGDGAAAAVVGAERGRPVKVVASRMETYSGASESCRVTAGGTGLHPCKPGVTHDDLIASSRFFMDGKAAYKVSAENIGGFVERLFGKTGFGIGDMDLVIPHQASLLAMHHLRRRLGIPEDRLVDIFRDHGNQVAASLPTALHHALSTGRVERGNRVLMIGTGAGISIAGMVLEFQ